MTVPWKPYSGAVEEERAPEFELNWRAFDAMIAYTRELVGSDGTGDLEYLVNGRIGVYDVTPNNPRARRINIIAEQWLIVTVGDIGGRWELDYTDKHLALGRQIIAATVAGRVDERFGFARSRVTVSLENGDIKRATGYDGCASLFVPQFGWTLWGRLKRYEPYRLTS